jgi:hypothetical protein
MDKINLAEDMDRWWSVANMVMDLGVLYSAVCHLVRRRWQIMELHIFGFRIY